VPAVTSAMAYVLFGASAQSLSGESLPLKAEVQRFLDGVRAA